MARAVPEPDGGSCRRVLHRRRCGWQCECGGARSPYITPANWAVKRVDRRCCSQPLSSARPVPGVWAGPTPSSSFPGAGVCAYEPVSPLVPKPAASPEVGRGFAELLSVRPS